MTTQGRTHNCANIGAPGLDAILHGGLIADRNHLVRSGPDLGKPPGAQCLRTGKSEKSVWGLDFIDITGDGIRAAEPMRG